MNVIDAQDLTKVYQAGLKKRGIVALDNVSFSVQGNEIFGLLGPNGAGKTTFLKIVLGITQMSAGNVIVGGYKPSDARSRQRLGYLPENHRFPDHLTGGSLLRLAGRMHGMRAAEIDGKVDRLLNLVGMGKWGTTKIRKYSKGMQQRIGLAQAMISDPEVLLLDEPTDGVDPVGKVEIREVLERVRSEGKAIVLNSHLLSEVESMADRVAILNRGRLVKVNTVEELTSRKSQFEIDADIGNRLITIPENVGKIIKLSAKGMIVELEKEESVNFVIDQLRMKKVSIRMIRPLRISLEQSFIETITTPELPSQEAGI